MVLDMVSDAMLYAGTGLITSGQKMMGSWRRYVEKAFSSWEFEAEIYAEVAVAVNDCG